MIKEEPATEPPEQGLDNDIQEIRLCCEQPTFMCPSMACPRKNENKCYLLEAILHYPRETRNIYRRQLLEPDEFMRDWGHELPPEKPDPLASPPDSPLRYHVREETASEHESSEGDLVVYEEPEAPEQELQVKAVSPNTV